MVREKLCVLSELRKKTDGKDKVNEKMNTHSVSQGIMSSTVREFHF